MIINDIHKLKCHCKSVEIELKLNGEITNPLRCNCSFCSMRSAIVGFVDQKDLKIVKGEDNLTLYQFKTNAAKHYFCKTCGIYTHHIPRSAPTKFGYNVACLENINTFELKDIKVFDGLNHPMDK